MQQLRERESTRERSPESLHGGPSANISVPTCTHPVTPLPRRGGSVHPLFLSPSLQVVPTEIESVGSLAFSLSLSLRVSFSFLVAADIFEAVTPPSWTPTPQLCSAARAPPRRRPAAVCGSSSCEVGEIGTRVSSPLPSTSASFFFVSLPAVISARACSRGVLGISPVGFMGGGGLVRFRSWEIRCVLLLLACLQPRGLGRDWRGRARSCGAVLDRSSLLFSFL